MQLFTLFIMLCRFCNWFGMFVTNLTIEITLTAICVILLTISILFLTIRYKVTPDKIQLKLTFVDILGNKVLIKNAIAIKLIKSTNLLYLNVMVGDGESKIMLISINEKKYTEFVKYLQTLNKDIIYSEEE
ncbi:MAG: hypothetical protein RR086_06065 [Clostridia bacterium]